MASKAPVYIAGVGYSTPSRDSKPATTFISAATKALLDAGITYDDITHGLSAGHGSEAFHGFGTTGIPLSKVDVTAALPSAVALIREKGAQCVLLVGLDKSGNGVAMAVTSDAFLWRHPYLRDSSAIAEERDSKTNMPKVEPTELKDLCGSVWALRGWSQNQKRTGHEHYLHRLKQSGGSIIVFELQRADKEAVPEWRTVEHKQDGKHRLGYNPMSETKDITFEDWLAVRASKKSAQKDSTGVEKQLKRKGGDRAALARL